MKVTVQVVVQADDDIDAPSVVREVLSVDRDVLAPDTLGLQRGEAMDLLSAVQGALVEEQAKAALATRPRTPEATTKCKVEHYRWSQVRNPRLMRV
jgi:hypothetical protein